MIGLIFILILIIWLFIIGCPKERIVRITLWACVILFGIQLFSSDASMIFLLMFAIVIIYLVYKSESNNKDITPTKNARPVSRNKTEIKKNNTPKKQKCDGIVINGSGVLDEQRKLFDEYKNKLNEISKEDKEYAFILHKLGLLYEKLHNDLFRATCYCYLATEYEKDNKEFENDYIRLCNLLEKKTNFNQLYRVTLINDISDINTQMDEIINEQNSKHKIIINKNIKTYIPRSIHRQSSTMNSSIGYSKFDSFDTESYLHSLGYKVGKTGLSVYQRKVLLKKIIDEGKVSKYEVEKTLEKNISLFSGRRDRVKAVNDWKMDLNYVRNL